jgi:hypothetical protein
MTMTKSYKNPNQCPWIWLSPPEARSPFYNTGVLFKLRDMADIKLVADHCVVMIVQEQDQTYKQSEKYVVR